MLSSPSTKMHLVFLSVLQNLVAVGDPLCTSSAGCMQIQASRAVCCILALSHAVHLDQCKSLVSLSVTPCLLSLSCMQV